MMRAYLGVLRGELARALIEFRRYPLEEAAYVFMFSFLFLIIYFFGKSMIHGIVTEAEQAELEKNIGELIAGYLVWLLFFHGTNSIAAAIRDVTQTGFLEQLFLTRFRPAALFSLRGCADFLVYLAPTVLIGAIIVFATGVTLLLGPTLLFVVIAVGLGSIGIGLALGGFVLVFKRIQAFSYLVVWSMLIFTTVPLDGSGIGSIPQKLFPISQGIHVFRESAIEGRTVTDLLVSGDIVWLLGGALLFFVLGWLVYNFLERVAREKALLGQY